MEPSEIIDNNGSVAEQVIRELYDRICVDMDYIPLDEQWKKNYLSWLRHEEII